MGIAKRIRNELGENIPWHVTGYYPAYRFTAPPTPIDALEKAREIGKKEGLNYVYFGNFPGHQFENTYCPKCGELVIDRLGYEIERFDEDGKCAECSGDLNLIL